MIFLVQTVVLFISSCIPYEYKHLGSLGICHLYVGAEYSCITKKQSDIENFQFCILQTFVGTRVARWCKSGTTIDHNTELKISSLTRNKISISLQSFVLLSPVMSSSTASLLPSLGNAVSRVLGKSELNVSGFITQSGHIRHKIHENVRGPSVAFRSSP